MSFEVAQCRADSDHEFEAEWPVERLIGGYHLSYSKIVGMSRRRRASGMPGGAGMDGMAGIGEIQSSADRAHEAGSAGLRKRTGQKAALASSMLG